MPQLEKSSVIAYVDNEGSNHVKYIDKQRRPDPFPTV